MISIDKIFNGKKIQAKKGDLIKVELAENSTSGYLWKINSLDNNHLSQADSKHEITEKAPGAAGTRTFFIKVEKEGTSELQFSLGNQWEKDTAETFQVTIES